MKEPKKSDLTVAQVAAIYDVTPQAVYTWIHKGAVEAHRSPGGTYRIPVDGLVTSKRFDVERARRLQQALALAHKDKEPVSQDEMLAQIRGRRAG